MVFECCKHLRKVPSAAPLDLIPESWRRIVVTPSGIYRQYYEICAMNELKGSIVLYEQLISVSTKKNLNEWNGLPLDMHLINSCAIMG